MVPHHLQNEFARDLTTVLKTKERLELKRYQRIHWTYMVATLNSSDNLFRRDCNYTAHVTPNIYNNYMFASLKAFLNILASKYCWDIVMR